MKLKNSLIVSALSLGLVVGAITPAVFKAREKVEPENVTYEDSKVLPNPFTNANFAEGDDPAVVAPVKVILHYHNDDGNNKDRRFYIWCDGKKGYEYMYDAVSEDGKDMYITLDYLNDERFQGFETKKGVYFIIKTKDVWTGQSEDTYVDYEKFPPNQAGVSEIWSIPGEGNSIEMYLTEEETKFDKIETAAFSNWKQIKAKATIAPSSYKLYAFTLNYFRLDSANQKKNKEQYLIKTGSNPTVEEVDYAGHKSQEFTIDLNYTVHINVQYSLEAVFPTNPDKGMTKLVSFENLYKTERFDRYYTYDGDDLGVHYDAETDTTTFKVWSPTAARVRLLLYMNGTPASYVRGSNDYFNTDMSFQPGGIWEAKFEGDYYGVYYNYFVYNAAGNFEVTDPYAKACGVNGERGMVVNFDETNPEGWDTVPEVWDGTEGYDIAGPNDLTVYESHVRDFTADESWKGEARNGTYSAYIEPGTTVTVGDKTASTGFDHLQELGVKAIQLQPVFDHDNTEVDPDAYNENGTITSEYNWGYNPLNYNCVEGSYATNPFDGASRIMEFKNFIKAFADTEAHTRIIMDVVYNHVSSAPASCFNKLMPRYYFRYTDEWAYWNGSGCGNEVKSEAKMMRKYIVDSICWWASEYKIKGFRFDLMALIDTETMSEVKKACYEIDPDIVLYGEGWKAADSGLSGSKECSTSHVYSDSLLYDTNNQVYLGGFNDAGRNALRGGNDQGWGSPTHLPGWGYMTQGYGDASEGNRNVVAEMLWGIHSGKGANPKQTVNYASCHDNWTLFDQYYYTLGNKVAPDTKRVMDASTATHAFVFASNGIAFMLGGEEIFRSKTVDEAARAEVKDDTYEKMYNKYASHNSYNSPDSVNAYKWENKISVDGVNTEPYTKAFKDMVKLHHSMTKFAFKDSGFPYHKTSAGNTIDNISWSGSYKGSSTEMSYHGSCGFQLDEYFVFLGGRNWSWIKFGDVPKCGDPLYSFGEYTYDTYNKTVNLGNFDNDTGAAIVVFYRGK